MTASGKEGDTATPAVKASTTAMSATTTTTSVGTDDVRTTTTTTAAASYNSRTSYFPPKMVPPELPQIDPHTVSVIWRDLFFILLGCVAISIIGFVETHAMDSDARLSIHIAGLFHYSDMPLNPHGIVDTGFIVTYPLYEFLKENRGWNDLLAGLNSFVLIFPSLYIAYITVWKGDYSCAFRVLALQLLRACCGWMTYLPPDPSYLNSNYDFPDFVQCLFQDCQAPSESDPPEALPFVSFFSGHVATMVVVGNHMALVKGFQSWAILIHVLNWLQIVRLLATRGHYSIDMIIGWYVAVYVTNPAGRLGRYYSHGVPVQEILPKTPQEAFEYATGVADNRRQRRMSALLHRPEVQEALKAMHEEDEAVESETTVRILQETASKIMQEQSEALQEEIQHLQQQARETMSAMREKRAALRAASLSGASESVKADKKSQ